MKQNYNKLPNTIRAVIEMLVIAGLALALIYFKIIK